jgi:hypothetical protein
MFLKTVSQSHFPSAFTVCVSLSLPILSHELLVGVVNAFTQKKKEQKMKWLEDTFTELNLAEIEQL